MERLRVIYPFDAIVLNPRDIDLARSPLAGQLGTKTYVLGACNPGLTRLPSGNLLMMVRVAEALRHPISDRHVRSIRWEAGAFLLDAWPLEFVDTTDPRSFAMRGGGWKVIALTSLSWLLPVELDPNGRRRSHPLRPGDCPSRALPMLRCCGPPDKQGRRRMVDDNLFR